MYIFACGVVYMHACGQDVVYLIQIESGDFCASLDVRVYASMNVCVVRELFLLFVLNSQYWRVKRQLEAVKNNSSVSRQHSSQSCCCRSQLVRPSTPVSCEVLRTDLSM